MLSLDLERKSFFEELKEKCGEPIELCYQCQKCASGCLATAYADYMPNEIIRLVQLGQKKRVLNSSSIWICSGCETCGARCPNKINIKEVMDALKEIAIKEGIIKEKRIHLFHTIFLNSVQAHGRVHELAMMVKYKLKSRDYFSDMDIGLELFKKGKLPLLSHGIKEKAKLRNIFEKTSMRNPLQVNQQRKKCEIEEKAACLR